MERRSFELRESTEGKTVEGIVIPYGQPTKISDFTEQFLPGSVRFGDVIADYQHDNNQMLARTGGGLTLTQTAKELRAVIELPDTTLGRDVRELIRTGVLRGLSAEFRTVQDVWNGNARTIREAILHGLGIVSRPAYAGATISELRSCAPCFFRRNALWQLV